MRRYMRRLRIKAGKYNIKSIVTSGQDLIFTFEKDDGNDIRALFANASVKIRISDTNVVYMRLAKNYFEPKTLINILRKMFAINNRVYCDTK